MNDDSIALIQALVAKEPQEPSGAFRWPHNSFLVRIPLHIRISDEEEWEAAATALGAADPELDDLATALLSRHAWISGRFAWVSLADRLWPRLQEQARARFLAGLSIGLSFEFETVCEGGQERLHVDKFFKEQIAGVTLDPLSACEIAVNVTLRNGVSTLQAVLSRPGIAHARVPRMDPLNCGFEHEVARLSERVADIALEVALKIANERAVLTALAAGADPNANIWNLERSYNERFCALAFAIDQGTPAMIDALLDAGASPRGTEYGGANQPLFYALLKGHDDLADRLLAMGATFGADPQPAAAPAGECETEMIWPRGPFFGYFPKELDLIRRELGPLIPLVDVTRKASHYIGDAQGGRSRTFLHLVTDRRDDLIRLQKYETLGLGTSLSCEEICGLIHADAWNCLVYLLGKHGAEARDQALLRLHRAYPGLGAGRRDIQTLPQDDGLEDDGSR